MTASFFHGSPYECIGREIQLEDDTIMVVTVELQPATSTPLRHLAEHLPIRFVPGE